MQSADAARLMFPWMPDEVFQGWLGEIIALQGWPFVSIEDSFHVDDWPHLLLNRTLAEWASFSWRKVDVDQIHQSLHADSRSRVMDLMMHHYEGPHPAGAGIRDSKCRYAAARMAIVENNGFPGFVTALRDPNGRLCVVDGHHRLAAWRSFSGTGALAVPIWVASQSGG